MKKRILLVLVVLALVFGSTAALAAGGSGSDPLISLSYLTGTYTPSLLTQADSKLDTLEQRYQAADAKLDAAAAGFLSRAGGGDTTQLYRAAFSSSPFHRGDVLTLNTGSGFLLLEGSAKVTHNGAVVDVTTGSTLSSGAALSAGHRYLVGEDTIAQFRFSSEAATAAVEGYYTYSPSGLNTMPFVDVSEDDWFHTAVTYAYGQGLFSGTATNTFSPNMNITRGMVVTVLYQLSGRPAVGSQSVFSDVPADAYYAAPVVWATGQGVVAGMGDGRFAPGSNISREQLACMLYAYALNVSGLDVSRRGDLSGYTDVDQISPYAQQAISWAVGVGIITGTDAHTLSPGGTATRAQMAAMLNAFRSLT